MEVSGGTDRCHGSLTLRYTVSVYRSVRDWLRHMGCLTFPGGDLSFIRCRVGCRWFQPFRAADGLRDRFEAARGSVYRRRTRRRWYLRLYSVGVGIEQGRDDVLGLAIRADTLTLERTVVSGHDAEERDAPHEKTTHTFASFCTMGRLSARSSTAVKS